MSGDHDGIPQDLERSDFQAPVRLCCGQRHFGPICPDGKVMCCLCFVRVDQDELHVDPKSGIKEDVCKPCAAEEAAMMERLKQQKEKP